MCFTNTEPIRDTDINSDSHCYCDSHSCCDSDSYSNSNSDSVSKPDGAARNPVPDSYSYGDSNRFTAGYSNADADRDRGAECNSKPGSAGGQLLNAHASTDRQ
jgi:hypothetical protein